MITVSHGGEISTVHKEIALISRKPYVWEWSIGQSLKTVI